MQGFTIRGSEGQRLLLLPQSLLDATMIRYYFPACNVHGPVDPIPFSHLGSRGSVPRKCTL
jgi:hypothetical protein